MISFAKISIAIVNESEGSSQIVFLDYLPFEVAFFVTGCLACFSGIVNEACPFTEKSVIECYDCLFCISLLFLQDAFLCVSFSDFPSLQTLLSPPRYLPYLPGRLTLSSRPSTKPVKLSRRAYHALTYVTAQGTVR